MTSPKLPPLNWLRAFEASARLLSFTEAARELNMTQSAVSQQIKALESQIGKHLFTRRTRALELTDVGLAYLPTVEAAFKLLYEGTQNIRGLDSDSLLEIRCNLAFSVFWLMPRIGSFIERFPWINLNIATTLWNTQSIQPFASVEIRFGIQRKETIAGDVLLEDEIFPVCNKAIAQQLPHKLLNQRLFDAPGIVTGWNTWMEMANLALPRNKVINSAETYVLTLNMAQRGLGVALAHNLVASDLIECGKLVRPYDICIPMQEKYFLVPAPKHTNQATKEFREWILNEMGKFTQAR